MISGFNCLMLCMRFTGQIEIYVRLLKMAVREAHSEQMSNEYLKNPGACKNWVWSYSLHG